MTVLRTTRSTPRRAVRRAIHGLVLALGFGMVLIGSLGCGREKREIEADPAIDPAPATDRPHMAQLPAPRSEFIDYSPTDRKLTLYDLGSSGRWMVKRADMTTAYPVGPEHILPEGLDAKETLVYYVRPGGQTSRTVTLAQIQSAHREHVSLR